MRLLLIFLTIFVSATLAEVARYHDFKVYKLFTETEHQIHFLKSLEGNGDFDFWTDIRNVGDTVDVMVAPHAQATFESFIRFLDLEFTVMINNVESLIENERIQQQQAKARKATAGTRDLIAFDQYYSFDEINDYLRALAAAYPNLVTLESGGSSLEGREFVFAKISSNASAEKPIILIDGGIHAREWISPATVLYIINQLVENGNATNGTNLLTYVDWYILPVLNPDGYEFSRNNTRLWRKTRSPGILCYGTDGNRNFDYYWGTTGASALECSETYRGSSANSEIETQNLIAFATKYASRIKLYLSYHSYGNYLLYPWGYVNSAPSNGDELQALGDAAAAAIRDFSNTTYTVGVSSTTLYATSGSSVDWIFGALNVSLSYTVELPGNGYGFLLPPSDVYDVVVETFESVKVFGNYVASLYGSS